MSPRHQRCKLLLWTAIPCLFFAARWATAQDKDPGAPPPEAPLIERIVRSSLLVPPCRSGRGLVLCYSDDEQDGIPVPTKSLLSRDATPQLPSRFARLTLLAGMFMGRVQAATVGNLRIRLDLAVK